MSLAHFSIYSLWDPAACITYAYKNNKQTNYLHLIKLEPEESKLRKLRGILVLSALVIHELRKRIGQIYICIVSEIRTVAVYLMG